MSIFIKQDETPTEAPGDAPAAQPATKDEPKQPAAAQMPNRTLASDERVAGNPSTEWPTQRGFDMNCIPDFGSVPPLPADYTPSMDIEKIMSDYKKEVEERRAAERRREVESIRQEAAREQRPLTDKDLEWIAFWEADDKESRERQEDLQLLLSVGGSFISQMENPWEQIRMW